MNSLIEEG